MNAEITPLLKKTLAHRNVVRIAWIATILALCVIVFGAFVRLSDAGLSCPDWPTCYGRASWPTAATAHEVANHAANAIRPVDTTKAWREQLHRHLASILGCLVFVLALATSLKRRFGWQQIIAAALLAGGAIAAQVHGAYSGSTTLIVLAEIILLFAAWRWSNEDCARVSAIAFAVIIFQAILGMWTVTWLLKPIAVMSHLIGGLTTFALLTWLVWHAMNRPILLAETKRLRVAVLIGIVLLAVQIALGGWVSSNYAALACANDFPKCVGQWWPQTDFKDAFVIWRGVSVDYEGGVLDGASRIAIQLSHRIMATIVGIYLLILGWQLMRKPGLARIGMALIFLVLLQITLGILNVKLGLPLHVAVMHNAGAALLLYLLVSLVARMREPEL